MLKLWSEDAKAWLIVNRFFDKFFMCKILVFIYFTCFEILKYFYWQFSNLYLEKSQVNVWISLDNHVNNWQDKNLHHFGSHLTFWDLLILETFIIVNSYLAVLFWLSFWKMSTKQKSCMVTFLSMNNHIY